VTARQAAAIVAEAETWLGTPFRHAAALKGIGVDCIHLVHAVYRAVGLTDVALPSYPPDWHLHQGGGNRLMEGLVPHCVPASEPFELGDILVYNYGRAPSHCAIYVGEGRVIHAPPRGRVRCDPVTSRPLASRFAGAFRVTV
jgi:NlpC/P60 family putative phage cell wall peptidase